MVERFHRQLKDGLRARCEGKDWLSHLPYVLLGLKAAPKEKADISSADVTFGAPLVLPSQNKMYFSTRSYVAPRAWRCRSLTPPAHMLKSYGGLQCIAES